MEQIVCDICGRVDTGTKSKIDLMVLSDGGYLAYHYDVCYSCAAKINNMISFLKDKK